MFVRYNQQIFTRLKYIVLLINIYHTNIIKNVLFIVYFVGNSIFKIFTFLYNWLRMKISTVLFLRRLFIFYIRNSILIYLYIQICICEWHDFLSTIHFSQPRSALIKKTAQRNFWIFIFVSCIYKCPLMIWFMFHSLNIKKKSDGSLEYQAMYRSLLIKN